MLGAHLRWLIKDLGVWEHGSSHLSIFLPHLTFGIGKKKITCSNEAGIIKRISGRSAWRRWPLSGASSNNLPSLINYFTRGEELRGMVLCKARLSNLKTR